MTARKKAVKTQSSEAKPQEARAGASAAVVKSEKQVVRKVARKASAAKITKRPAKNRGRRAYKRYSDAERQRILSTAQREGLTGTQVSKRFGISTLTYYLWRKKAGSARGRRGARPSTPAVRDGNVAARVQREVRAKIQQLLPGIVAEEVGRYLEAAFRSPRGTR